MEKQTKIKVELFVDNKLFTESVYVERTKTHLEMSSAKSVYTIKLKTFTFPSISENKSLRTIFY